MRHILHWEICKLSSKHSFGDKSFLLCKVVDVNVNLADICEGRFWGSDKFSLNLSFSIHKRQTDSNGWTHQLIAPGGVHVYCVSEQEAKDVAEGIYKRMQEAFDANTERVRALKLNKLRRLKNTKRKKEKLLSLINGRGIMGKVYYSSKHPIGWMFVWDGKTLKQPDRLGHNFAEAVEFIEDGALDFFYEEEQRRIHGYFS